MFHACPVKISSTDAISSPRLVEGKSAIRPSTKPGMKAITGMLCRMSSTGMSTRSARGSLAAQ